MGKFASFLSGVIFFVGLLAFTVAAPVAAAETVTIGVSIPSATHGWTGGINWWAEKATDELESRYEELDIVLVSAGGPEEQANDLADLVAIHDIDALVVLPFESDPLTGPVKFVADKGVFVTVVDRGLTEEGIEDIYVAGDNDAFGRVAGTYFVNNLDPGSKIVVLRGVPSVVDNDRFNGFTDVVEDSEIELLDWEYANWNRDDAFTVTQDFLIEYPDIDAIWAADDDVAEGVIAAVKQSGRADEMIIVGGGGKKEMIKRVMDGDRLTPVDVMYPPGMIATAMELTVLNYVSDVPVLGEYILQAPLVTPDNAAQYYHPNSIY